MAGTGQILTIGSRNGGIRDLVPIFRVGQLPANLAAIALLLWMAWMDDGRLPALGLLYASLFWLAQYGLRPSSMRLSEAQARLTEAELSNGGDYRQDEADGRWWPATGHDPYAWLWPEKSIGFERAREGVTIVAPRQVGPLGQASRSRQSRAENSGKMFLTRTASFSA